MDKQLRNTLRNVVTQCRRLLEKAVAEVLQGQFGIHPDGQVENTAHMGHLSEEERQYREQILIHLEHIKASGFKPKDAVEQLVREVAFTHLNRLCAYNTPKELREQARKESQAPRNSYELAFRNQFYTPRYVVQFLTDNTLGRMWYECARAKPFSWRSVNILSAGPRRFSYLSAKMKGKTLCLPNPKEGECKIRPLGS